MAELVPIEVIEHKILLIRGEKVMLDNDLAKLYGVETKRLTRAVRRNIDRFPKDFMFRLNLQEQQNLRCQFGTLGWGAYAKYPPLVFTEQGVAMLSSVLNSERAIAVNIQIMRTFTKLRRMLMDNKALKEKVEALESKYDKQFKIVFDVIKELLEPPPEPSSKQFGFKPNPR